MARPRKLTGPPVEYVPYQNNDNVVVYYELKFGPDLMIPGTKFKMKYDRDIYRFIRLAHHIKHDNTWVDAISTTRGSWHSLRIDNIKGIVKQKKSRRMKKVEQ